MRLLVVHPGAEWSTADVYSGYVRALEARGHKLIKYRLDTRLADAGAYLETTWKRRGKPEPPYSRADVYYLASYGILERAARFQVDGVLIFSAMHVHPDVLAFLRWYGIRTGMLFTESPYEDEYQARIALAVDVCWTNERSSLPLLRLANPNTFYLAHAYDPLVHYDDEPDESIPAHDVVFVGTGFEERCDLLAAVDWSGIDFGLYGTWPLLGSRSKLRKHLREGPVPNQRVASLYRRAKIGLNLHRTSRGFGRGVEHIERAESLNPRAFELAACGVFQLSDHRAELDEIFVQSVPTFETAAELEMKIRRYLPWADAREHLAAWSRELGEGQTFAERAAQMEADLERVWSEASATHRRALAALA